MTHMNHSHSLPHAITSQLGPFYAPFETHDGRHIFARRLYGFEAVTAFMSETGGGCSGFTGSVAMKLFPSSNATVRDEWSIQQAIKRSWMKIRFQAPSIAARAFAIPAPNAPSPDGPALDGVRVSDGYYLTYIVPRGIDDVMFWAEETIHFHPAEYTSLRDLERQLTGDYWDAGDGRYVIELHVAKVRVGDEWNISIHGSHFGTDARFCYLLLDELVSLVIEDLQDTGKSTVAMTSLPWGTEVAKLQPSAALAMSGSGDNTATQNATSATETANDPVDIRAEPSGRLTTPVPPPVFFFRPYPHIPNPPAPPTYYPGDVYPRARRPASHPNVTTAVILSGDETAAFRRACKLHGRTVTAVVDAILVLAELEVVMQDAAKTTTDTEVDWHKLKRMYNESAFMLVPLKFIDMRPSLPGRLSTLSEQISSTPPFVLATAVHMHPMEGLRKAVTPIETSAGVRISIDASEGVFWNGVVRDSAKLWETSKPSPQAFVENEATIEATLPHGARHAEYLIPAILSSSPGDYDHLGSKNADGDYGVLGRWNNSVRGPPTLDAPGIDARVVDISLSVRMGGYPFHVCECLQYDGSLRLLLAGSSRWYRQEDIDVWATAVKRWVERVSEPYVCADVV